MEIQLFETVILVVHLLAALAIIGLVLIQQGRGADMGAGFGGGASNTVFGSAGTGSFLTKMTTMIAIAFFVTSFGLAIFAKQHAVDARGLGIPKVVEQVEAPAPVGEEPSLSELPVVEDPPKASEE